MKVFFVVLLIVLAVLTLLTACAPERHSVEEYVGTLPGWAIIIGAVVLFFVGFGLIWKLIPGFIKVIAVIALAVILAGTAYGLWESPWAEKLNQGAEDIRDSLINNADNADAELTSNPS